MGHNPGMKGLALVVALVVGAQAAPLGGERGDLMRGMADQQRTLRPYSSVPAVQSMTQELRQLQGMARHAPEAQLGAVRSAYYDWQRRKNAYLSGGSVFYPSDHSVAQYRQAPRGYAAHPTRKQAEEFNRRHIQADRRVAKAVAAAPFAARAEAPAVRAARQARPYTPAPRRSQLKPARDRDRALPKTLRRRAPPPPRPVIAPAVPVANTWSPTWSGHNPLEPLGHALDDVGRGVGQVLEGGARTAGTIIGGLLSVPLAVFEGVTSGFGYRSPPRTVYGRGSHFHAGVDYRAAVGTPVQAGGDGVVALAGWYGGYGKAIIIDHGAGVQTLYGHLSVTGVRVGQTVHRGMVIAKSGATGNVTGPHLHYEMRRNGRPFNPLDH